MMFRTSSPINFTTTMGSSSAIPSAPRLRRGNSRGFDQMTPLVPDFFPGDDDVLVGRGKKCLCHTGNIRFKQIVATKLSAYLQAECRVDKTAILMEVISQVRSNSPNGGFVKQNPKTGQYYEVGDFLAKEKTAQAFRDALHEYYSSSNPSKKKRRIQSTTSAEKKHSIDDDDDAEDCNNQENFEGISQRTEQTLVDAMHTQFTRCMDSQRQTKSVPCSPVRNENMEPRRTQTPPPSFAHFLTEEPSFARLVSEEPIPTSLTALNRGANLDGPARRKSSVILGETLAILSSALGETGFVSDSTGGDNDVTGEDPFEPIPLSLYDNMAISDLA